jgi:hypothetical protein
MKMCERRTAYLWIQLFVLLVLLTGCVSLNKSERCTFSEPPEEGLLSGRLRQLEIVDAETGEISTYDSENNPVFEGGQPLALWAEFDQPTHVELCVVEAGGSESLLHQSEVTFTEEVDTQPLGRYDLGSYLLHISMDGTLVSTIEFKVQ